MYVSIRGKVILLNSILNSISIFFLSFLKMDIEAWKRIAKIKRKLLRFLVLDGLMSVKLRRDEVLADGEGFLLVSLLN